MKTKVFISGNVLATAVVETELVEGFFVRKVYVHWNYTTSQEKFSDSKFGSPDTHRIMIAIKEWCNKKRYNLWSY